MARTRAWAELLGNLYNKTTPAAFSIKDPLKLAPRWVPDPSDNKQVEIEAKELNEGYCLCYAHVRQGIARIAVAGYSQKLGDILAHPDPAIRAAAYRDAELTAEQMKAADAKDPQLAFNYMLYNRKLW